jgi:hypothetical protein
MWTANFLGATPSPREENPRTSVWSQLKQRVQLVGNPDRESRPSTPRNKRSSVVERFSRRLGSATESRKSVVAAVRSFAGRRSMRLSSARPERRLSLKAQRASEVARQKAAVAPPPPVRRQATGKVVAVSSSNVGAATATGNFALSKRATEELAALKARKEHDGRVAALMRRLWAATQVGRAMALKDYLDYHLSMFVYLEKDGETLDGCAYLDAWGSALEDWETDISGGEQLTFGTFRESVEELVEAYSQAEAWAGAEPDGGAETREQAFERVLRDIVAGTVEEVAGADGGEAQARWRYRWPPRVVDTAEGKRRLVTMHGLLELDVEGEAPTPAELSVAVAKLHAQMLGASKPASGKKKKKGKGTARAGRRCARATAAVPLRPAASRSGGARSSSRS